MSRTTNKVMNDDQEGQLISGSSVPVDELDPLAAEAYCFVSPNLCPW